MRKFNIPRDRIFDSRQLTFQRDVLSATNGRGVDVVLNSLSGELLHASWKCVAQFGCMIEIGKRDLIGKGALALNVFEQNRTYFGVDFAQICTERPSIISR
jgi:NADPH:quinone reductase-like Zn-dependent oxidoreductase